MKRTLLAPLMVAGFVASAGTGHALVNCNQVNKYLQTGRTPQDVSDTMVIPIDDVKKCQAEAGAKGAAAAAPGSGAAPADAAKGAEKK